LPEPASPPTAALSWRRPLGTLRHLRRMPAYRLGTLRRGRRTAATAIWLAVAALLWGGSTIPALTCSMAGEWAGFGEILLMMGGRLAGCHLFWIAAAVCGALAFSPERRGRTMDQLALLPQSGAEVALSRALAAAEPLFPAVLLSVALEFVLIPWAGSRLDHSGDDSALWFMLLFALFSSTTTASAALLAFALGLWAALLARTAGRALLLTFGLLALTEGAYLFLSAVLWPVSLGLPLLSLAAGGLFLRAAARGFDRLVLEREDPEAA